MATIEGIETDCWCGLTIGVPITATKENPRMCRCGCMWIAKEVDGEYVSVLISGPSSGRPSYPSNPWWWSGHSAAAAFFWMHFTVLVYLVMFGLIDMSFRTGFLAVLYFVLAVLTSVARRNT